MLFSVTKMKTLSTQTVPFQPTQPKKLVLHAMHAYVFRLLDTYSKCTPNATEGITLLFSVLKL